MAMKGKLALFFNYFIFYFFFCLRTEGQRRKVAVYYCDSI